MRLPFSSRFPGLAPLPRGGVPVAAEVAAALDAPLDLILVQKIGVSFQPELAMGAVVDGGASIIVRNEDVIQHAARVAPFRSGAVVVRLRDAGTTIGGTNQLFTLSLSGRPEVLAIAVAGEIWPSGELVMI